MRIGVADYGIKVWDGANYDFEERCRRLKEIGYEGIERLQPVGAEDALAKAAFLKTMGMDFATVRAANPELSMRWTAALGKTYVWTDAGASDFDSFCRQVNTQAEACRKLGIRVALHNHMGTLVETSEQLEEFLCRCPECYLVFDTAHLAVAGGDPMHIVRTYPERLAMVHVKDWIAEREAENYLERGRFCVLGEGNIGLDNAAIVRELVTLGYDGWICVEQDTHLSDPFEDLAKSRDYLRSAGL